MYVDRSIDRDRRRTISRFFCACGIEDIIHRREMDIVHDLLPFPRPASPRQPQETPAAISKAELLEMLREVVDELLDERLESNW